MAKAWFRVLLALNFLFFDSVHGLRYCFCTETCPNVEQVIFNAVADKFSEILFLLLALYESSPLTALLGQTPLISCSCIHGIVLYSASFQLSSSIFDKFQDRV